MSEKIINSTASQHQIQFNNYLVEFIQKVRDTLPEDHSHKRLLAKYYKYYRKFVDQNKRVDFIQEFVQYISKYNTEISKSDEGLFSEDPEYYPKKPIQLLKGIDFKPLWLSEELTDKTKESIWKYLQTLYVLGTFVLKESQRMTDLLRKQQDIIQNIVQSLKLEQKIKDDAEKEEEEERQKAAESGFDFSSLQELFGEGNIITEMAVEIAKELNLPNEKLSDPIEAIRLLFGQDGQRLQEIITKVGQKLHDKLQKGGFTEEQLLNEAKKMNEKLVGQFKNIPGMPDIEKFTQKISDQITKEMEEKRKNGDNNSSNSSSSSFMPSSADLIKSLNQNLSEFGLDNLEQMNKNFSEIFNELKKPNENIPDQNQPQEKEIDRLENDQFETTDELDRELDELKKTLNSNE